MEGVELVIYVRLQGESVYLQYVLYFVIINVKYGSSLELRLPQERPGLQIADRMFNSLIITLAV